MVSRNRPNLSCLISLGIALCLCAGWAAASAAGQGPPNNKPEDKKEKPKEQPKPKPPEKPEPPPIPVSRAAVDARVREIVAYLWKVRNAEGHWDAIAKPKEEDKQKDKDDKEKEKPKPGTEFFGTRGATTSLALLALKVAGEDEQDARYQKALKWLAEQPWQGTYFRGLRATLYSQLKDPKWREPLFKEGEQLLDSLYGADGMYWYNPPLGPQFAAHGTDFSNTQYGVLGMWSAADRGFEVPIKYWQMVEAAYVASVCDDGGFAYKRGAVGQGKDGKPVRLKGYGTMTAAAIASMFVIWEKLYILNDKDCEGKVNRDLVKAIESGLGWMAKHFSAVTNPEGSAQWPYYYFYAMERAGVASGLKYFGQHDWYKEVAFALLNKKVKGHYDVGVHDRSWELLFLCYGRAPVAFNKLDYGRGWNEHPREFAMLCRYLSRTYEKHHNWQIMPLTARQDDFHDAPILAMSGRNAFALKPDEVSKIRTYLQRGGMLFGEAIGASAAFGNSFKALCQQLFPHFELVRLGPEHPIYTAHAQLKGGQPELMGLSDGVRTLIIFSPREISCDWQRLNTTGTGQRRFEIGDNLVQFASDGGQLWSKEESYWPIDRGAKPDKTIVVGRLIHGDAKAEQVWNPTGGTGWQRLDIISRNSSGPGIVTQPTDLGQPLDARKVPILHVTGIGAVMLSEQAKKNLKQYAESGGLILADAAGGKPSFTESFSKLCEEVFASKLAAAPPQPFAAIGTENGKVWYRHRESLPRSLRSLEMAGHSVGGQWNVLLLPYDLTYGLVGGPASEPAGLDPASATRLMLAILASRCGTPVPIPDTQPTTAADEAPQ